MTYKNRIWLKYDNSKYGFEAIEESRHEKCPLWEGWGLTHDKNYLYASDGSDTIYVFLPN